MVKFERLISWTSFFETYLSLNEDEEEERMEEIRQLDKNEAEQIFELPNSWRDKGRKEGIQEGIQKVAMDVMTWK